MNKKIKNAQESLYNGISFRSKQELNVYKLFLENGIRLEYEPKKATLLDSFVIQFDYFDSKSEKNKKELVNKKGTKILPMTYTPDFIYKGKRRVYVIEVKGFANDTFPLKKKLFLSMLNNSNKKFAFAILYNIPTAKQLLTIIKQEENDDKQQA